MDEEEIMNRARSDIFSEAKTVTIDENVRVTDNSVEIDSKTTIDNNTTINKKLEVGGM